MSLTHQFVQDHLQSQLRLSPSEQAAVADHLANCPECQAYAALHQALLKTLADPRPLRHADRDIRAKAAAVQAAVEKRRSPFQNVARLFQNSLSLAGAAAVVVLIFMALILIPRMMPAHPAPLSQSTGDPTGSGTAASTAQPVTGPAQSFLSAFPMNPGAAWVYTKTGYAQAAGDAQTIIRGTAKIEERVADVKTVPPYTLVHIQGNKTLVSADAGWQENGAFPLGDYQYWYVIKDNQIYLSSQQPAAASLDLSKLVLSYQFPMTAGAEWCLGPQRGSIDNPTPAACESRRVVTAVRTLAEPTGEAKPCYEIHDVANSGDVVTQFCAGVGIVSIQYQHGGSQFGFEQALTSFKAGKDSPLQTNFAIAGAARPTLIPSPANPLSNLQNRVRPSVAVEGQIAYVGLGARLAAIDISHPAAPQLLAQSAELPGAVTKVIILRDPADAKRVRLAISAGRYLAVIDASDPGELTLITQSKLPGPISTLILDLSSGDLYAGGALQADDNKGFIARLSTSTPDTLELLGTVQLAAPVQSLALAQPVLYAALKGNAPGVVAVSIRADQFGEPAAVISGVTVTSLTATGGALYLGTAGQLLAYDLASPTQPKPAWQITQANGAPIPGGIDGFEVRPYAIFAVGLDSAGQPFRLALTPPAALKTGSMVDSASCVVVTAGQMVIAGDRLEIYDSRDSQALKLLGAFPLTAPPP